MRFFRVWTALFGLMSSLAWSQEHPHMHHDMAGMGDSGAMAMKDVLGLGMSREGSGTGWQPDSTPVYGHHFMAGDWAFMVHYNLIAGYDAQGTSRGGSQVSSTNWVMLMARHDLLEGQLTAKAMLSAEPLTTGGPRGYPLLLQTGESVNGQPLHDRQHPHDLFMEAALDYKHKLGSGFGVEIYLAPAGEPALGPTAFPHRLSASPNPFAPLGHHWEDSTHVSFGVITAGLYTDILKLEGSWFNGREPDQYRYDFDFRMPDSYSARLSYNPAADWSFQISYGYLKSPEALEPNLSIDRVTASAIFNHRVDETTNWATTAVFGYNMPSSGRRTAAGLIESNLEFNGNSIFGRGEIYQRTTEDLSLEPADALQVFTAGVVELGYLRDLMTLGQSTLGVGAMGSVDVLGPGLSRFYGTAFPLGGMAFVRLRPAAMPRHMTHDMSKM